MAAERKLADQLYENGKTEEAKAIYQRLAASFANDYVFNKRLADCFFNSPEKQFDQAALYYARAYQLNPSDPQVEMNLGKAYSWSKQYEAAISVFRRITTRNPANPNGWLELARAQNYAGQVQAASTTYRSYLDRWFNDREVRLEFAAFLSWNKQLVAALEQYRAVLKVAPNNLKARLGEAEVLSWQGNLEESLQAYNNILLILPNRYEALRGRAFVLLWLQRYEEAGKAFAEANRQKPPDRDIQEALRQIARWQAEEPVRQAQAALNALRLQAEEAMARNELSRAIELFQQAIARAPDDNSLRFRLGQAHLWNRQWSEAIEIFQQLSTADSQNIEALRQLGHAQVGANRLAEAAATFRTYLQRSPDPAVRLTLARVLSWAGKIEEAIAVYQQILESEPDHFDASLGLAQVLSWQGQYEKALELYEALLRQRPGSREALLGKAQSLYWSGSIEKALVMLETMRETWPRDQELAGILQSVREAEQQRAAQTAATPPPVDVMDVDALISKYQELLSRNPNDRIILEMLGDLYLQKNDYTQAILFYERLLEQEPTDAPLRLKVAKAASWNRDFPRAVSLYQHLVAQAPDNREYRMELAKNLNWSGRNAESLEQYREILKHLPDDKEARLALARELSWNQQLAESLQEYERLLQAAPGDRDALVERARVLSWNGELAAALNLYDDVLIRVPDDRDARFGKAQVLYWSGRLREAQAILEELQALYPEDRDVALTAAGVHAGLGRTGLALRRLDELDKLQPGNAEVQSMRRRLRQDLRPSLILGFTPSQDIYDLTIYSSTAALYFSPVPQVRSYFFSGITPSHDPTGSQTGREVLFGSYGRVNDRLLLRGEIGGNSATSGHQGPIGGAGATFHASDNMQFDFDFSRRFLNYIPKPVLLGINRVEWRAAWDWRPGPRAVFHVDYSHQRYSDTNRNNAINFSATRNFVRNERLELVAGYLYTASGFSKDISSGFFAPSQLQRHALLFNVQGKLTPRIGLYFWGSLGGEQIFRDPFRLDGTARFAGDFTVSEHFKFIAGYGYFALSSIATAGAYRTHTGYLTLEFRF
ncbi:MAG: tetratricopeptide repeat protein [Acidobacteria bacterium]|nr:tetratricopeptide repeat protein [Acidobacteriota bacterium]